MTHGNAESERDSLFGYVVKPAAEVTAESLLAAIGRTMSAHYEPVGVVLHPKDDAVLRVHATHDMEAQKAIADAFEIPYWVAGIAGYKAPLRLRLRAWPRKTVRRVQRRARSLLERLPGVQWAYPTVETGWTEEPAPRAGRWFVRFGGYRLGKWTDPDDW